MLKNNGFHNRHSPILRAFSPLSLFSGGAPGAWYDPSDYGATGTLFQDSAGTTPVTAVEQPVGLMLDKSQGLVLGPELVVNGDFSNGTTGWTGTDATLSVSSGQLQVALTGFRGGASTPVTVTANKWYKISITFISGISNALLQVGTSVNSGTYLQQFSPAGTYTVYVFPTVGTIYISLRGDWTAGQTFVFDNISVRELPGNHAFQATSASRPVLSARYNLLTKTEDFSDAAWVKYQASVTANSTTSPDGATTADSLVNDGTSNFHGLRNAPFTASSSPFTYSAYCKASTISNVSISLTSGNPYTTDGAVATFDLIAGTVSKTAGPAYVSSSITSVGNGWYRCSLTASNAALIYGWLWLNSTNNPTYAGFGYETFAGTAGQLAYIWGASLVPANQSTLPYQRVNTATDYNTTGFLPYLRFDGVDDSLSTNSISFTATDKMSVFAGVRKLTDVQYQVLVESSANSATTNGTFSLLTTSGVSGTNPNRLSVNSRGTINVVSEITGMPASKNYVFGMFGDINADSLISRVDGVQTTFSSSDQGTGNYGNYPLFIGRRNNASLPFNGQMYSMIIVGKAVTAGELSSTETFVATKTGVTL